MMQVFCVHVHASKCKEKCESSVKLPLFFNNLCLVKVGGDIKSDCRDWRRLEHS